MRAWFVCVSVWLWAEWRESVASESLFARLEGAFEFGEGSAEAVTETLDDSFCASGLCRVTFEIRVDPSVAEQRTANKNQMSGLIVKTTGDTLTRSAFEGFKLQIGRSEQVRAEIAITQASVEPRHQFVSFPSPIADGHWHRVKSVFCFLFCSPLFSAFLCISLTFSAPCRTA